MNVQYYGLGCFKLATSNFSVLINPFSTLSGLVPPKGQTDAVLFSNIQKEGTAAQAKQLVDRPGEYDIAGCSIVGLPNKEGNEYKTVFWLEMDGIRLMYLGSIAEWNVDKDEVDRLGQIDVLMVPVGGGKVMDFSRAAKIARELEARLVIPSFFALPGLKQEFEKPDRFLQEMGSKAEPQDKVKITLKDLSTDGAAVAYLVP